MSAGPFKDHFSGVAGGYAKARPGYPDALFDWLASEAPARDAAWDAGCGSGQASVALAGRFARVVATDASAEQVANAAQHPRVAYRAVPAEEAPEERAFDLVTVAQALHWFDLPRFWDAVRHAARPGALVAAFSYGPVRADDPGPDDLLRDFDAMLHARAFWPPERRLVDEGYASVALPFPRVAPPAFAMEARWDLAALLAYVETWSAVVRLRAAGDAGRLDALRGKLLAAWGDPAHARAIRWPLVVLAGRA